jgi:hypothetical protein
MHRRKVDNHEGKNSHPDRKLEGRYANYFKVGYNAFEFIFDFGQYYSENEEAELYTRIVTSPCYAKELMKTLSDAIERYEKAFGNIQVE